MKKWDGISQLPIVFYFNLALIKNMKNFIITLFILGFWIMVSFVNEIILMIVKMSS